jgi:hypothetical protein
MTVAVGPGEDLDELASRYLGDASRKWIIKDYNQIGAVTEGQLILIPRGNYRPGGLTPDGYQTVPVLAYPDLVTVKSEQIAKIVDSFQRQMQFLQTEGYHVVDIHQLTDFLAFKATLPPKAVVLTFDDQSRLFYDLIFPILQEHQIPVTLFIAPPEVGTASMADWSQLKEMSEAGIDIQYRFSKELAGSLDQSHFPDRNRLMQIMTTLVSERDRIEMKIGQPCRYLAYPEGKLAALIVILSEKAGFSGGFNRKAGSNPFYRNRFVIQRDGVRWDEAIDSYRKHLAVFKKEVLR